MNKFNFKFRILLLSTLLALFTSVQAMADVTICRGFIGAKTVDNLRVPENATCNLSGTRVKGTIYVGINATLTAWNIIVIGNVHAENSKQVNVLEGSRIGGSVQVALGGGSSVNDSFIDADLQYGGNSGILRAMRNSIGGNLQVLRNTGKVDIRKNVIDGNLQCTENVPAPIGGANVVGGTKEGQCRRL